MAGGAIMAKSFPPWLPGGGFKGGQVVGASDAKGEVVKTRPVYPCDLLGSMYELMGIDPNGKTAPSRRAGRPGHALCRGSGVPRRTFKRDHVSLLRQHFHLTAIVVAAMAAALQGQQTFAPHVAYVYPAGGRQGASFQVKVGGQYLANVTNACVSGEGIQAEVMDYTRPLTPQQANQLRQQLKELQDKRAAARLGWDSDAPTNGQARLTWTAADQKMIAEIREKLTRFRKRTVSPVMAEVVTVKMTISSNAEPGERELRLGTPSGLSEPLVFCVGQLPEFVKPTSEVDSDSPSAAPSESHVLLPCVVNGQIMPGGVDRYRFQARKGQRLVIAATARDLIPYLADAVPGWFQAALSLYDARGKEAAYADHYLFHPDPVLFYEVPKDGEYIIQIRDSIYRGREDFVYRISAGELPFVTGLFPLGGPAGEQTTVKLSGWNLDAGELTQSNQNLAPGVYPVQARAKNPVSNHLPFAVDTLPECLSSDSNHSQAAAQSITLPIIVNGRISQAGRWDVFRFDGRAGKEIVAEVIARRLDSPLDSVLRLTDASGKQLAFNDDYEDKGAGLQTQYADSYFRVKLPADGPCYLYLGDAQQQGGPEYAYRLRVGPPRPDFDLRVVPSSLVVRGGMSVPLTAFALRRDGFSNEITLALKDTPEGFTLSGATVPGRKIRRASP